jgi:Mg2+/Co2+ transporter CorC
LFGVIPILHLLVFIEDLICPAYFASENAKISKVLKELKTGQYHIAVVVDKFGYTQ